MAGLWTRLRATSSLWLNYCSRKRPPDSTRVCYDVRCYQGHAYTIDKVQQGAAWYLIVRVLLYSPEAKLLRSSCPRTVLVHNVPQMNPFPLRIYRNQARMYSHGNAALCIHLQCGPVRQSVERRAAPNTALQERDSNFRGRTTEGLAGFADRRPAPSVPVGSAASARVSPLGSVPCLSRRRQRRSASAYRSANLIACPA